jgi:PKD repeat protein
LTYSAVSLPAGLTIDAGSGVISGTVAVGAAGTYTVTVSASDGSLTGSSTFTWIVTRGANHAPTLTPPADQTSAEHTAVSLQLAASDPDGDPLTYGATGLPAALTIDAGTGRISGTLTYSSAGTYTVTAIVSDGSVSASATFTWTVANVDRAPTLTTPVDQTNTENQTVSLQIVASDPDGDTLTYTATGLPPALSIDAATGLISGALSSPAQAATP